MAEAQMAVCADCGFIDDTVKFDEDNNCFLCPSCLYDIELLDWADETMEEFGWVEVLYVTEENRSCNLANPDAQRPG